MRHYFIFIVILFKGFFANSQNSDVATKLNEAKFAYEINHDCILANKILDEVSRSSINHPLFIYYKYKIYSGETYECSDIFYIDSALFYLEKYLQFFPSNLELQKKFVELSITKRKKDELLLEFYRDQYTYSKRPADGEPFRFSVEDSLWITKENNASIIKIAYTPYMYFAGTFKDDAGNFNSIDYGIEKTKILPVKIYFTIIATSPVVALGSTQLLFKGKIFLDSIKNGIFNNSRSEKKGKKWENINYNGVCCNDAITRLKQEIDNLDDLFIRLSKYYENSKLRKLIMVSNEKDKGSIYLVLNWDCKKRFNPDCCYDFSLGFLDRYDSPCFFD